MQEKHKQQEIYWKVKEKKKSLQVEELSHERAGDFIFFFSLNTSDLLQRQEEKTN